MTKDATGGKLAGAIMALGLALAVSPASVGAATIAPDTTSDDDASDSTCSLREAVIAANTDGNYNGCLGNGTGQDDPADTIVLTSGQTYTLTRTGSESSSTRDLDVDYEALTIQSSGGVGAPATIDANHIDRAIEMGTNNVVPSMALSNLIIKNGSPSFFGGGAFLQNGLTGSVTISGSRFTGNSASLGGALYLGGAGATTITNSTKTSASAPPAM